MEPGRLPDVDAGDDEAVVVGAPDEVPVKVELT